MKKTILLTFMLSIFYLVDAQESINYKLKDKTIEFTISNNEVYLEYEKIQEGEIMRVFGDSFMRISENSIIINN